MTIHVIGPGSRRRFPFSLGVLALLACGLLALLIWQPLTAEQQQTYGVLSHFATTHGYGVQGSPEAGTTRYDVRLPVALPDLGACTGKLWLLAGQSVPKLQIVNNGTLVAYLPAPQEHDIGKDPEIARLCGM